VRRVGIVLLLLLGPACAPATPENAAVERDYPEQRSTVEVTAEGVVTSVLADCQGSSLERDAVERSDLTEHE
jgi:hypothetical protein